MIRNSGILSGVGMIGTAIAAAIWGERKSFQDFQTKEWERREARKFKNKYSSSLLNLGDLDLWDNRGTLLRSSRESSLWDDMKMPTHPTLKEAWKHKDSIEKSRILHRQGCQDIYESSERKYFDDFKYYCSKNNKEGISGTWVKSGSNLEGKIKNLGSAKKLSSEFSKLQELIISKSSTEFSSELLKVCQGQEKNIYMGEKDLTTENIRSFCIE